jgi:hypothetical protein
MDLLLDIFPFIYKKPAAPQMTMEEKEEIWKHQVDRNFLLYGIILALFSLMHILYHNILGYWREEEEIVDPRYPISKNAGFEVKLFGLSSGMAYFLKIYLCQFQLRMIIGLCSDGGKSYVSKFLRSKAMQV